MNIRPSGFKLSLALILTLVSLQSQAIYRWTDENGKAVYGDNPPSNAKNVQKKNFRVNDADETPLSYSLDRLVKLHPVVLYTAANCDPCNQGRTLLNQRGIPFTEKSVVTEKDQDEFKKLGGGTQFPMLTVGKQKELGFQSDNWTRLLDAANYPKTSQLPKGYKNASAQPLTTIDANKGFKQVGGDASPTTGGNNLTLPGGKP